MGSNLVLRPAKITPPQVRKVLARTHLLAQLERGRQLPLTMLITHAGGGKTMLAADFVRLLEAPVAWYSLETSDNDFSQFGAYLVEAIRRVVPEFGDSLLGYIFPPILEQSATNLNKASVIATTLIERLATAFSVDLYRLKDKMGEFWLVLDDYQFAQSPANNYFLQQVVRELPPDFHLLMLSRELPEEFPFAEFMVGQRAEIIGVDQFRFTLNEIENLLGEQFDGLKGAPALAQQIYEFTQGWAVAVSLTLAGLEQTRQTFKYQNLPLEQVGAKWLEQLSNPRPAQVMPELVNEPLFNYLTGVLFNQQPPDRQLFLLQTSVLDALSEEACDWLTGQPGTSYEHLAALERQYLFLSRLDSSLGLYQYHVLIKTFLQFRLASNPELARQSYERAATLNEKNGHFLQALDFYLKAGEHSRAVNLLNKVALSLYETGQIRTLNQMMRLLPDKLVQEQPNLLQVKGMLAQETGRYDEARLLFQQAAHLYELGNESDLATKARADAAFSLIPVDAYDQAREEACKILEYPLNGGRWATLAVSMAYLALGLVAQRTGRFDEAEQNFQSAEKLFHSIGDKYRVNVAVSTRAGLYCAMGQFIKAKSLFQRTLPYWERTGNLAREAYAYYWLALILRRTGKYSEAISSIEENLERLRATGYGHLEPYALHELANCYRELGDYTQADHYFRQTENLIKAKIPLLEIELLSDWGLNYWLQGRRFQALELYEEARELVVHSNLPQKEIDVRLASALSELDRPNLKAAIENLQRSLELLNQFPLPVLRSRALLLLAAAYAKSDKKMEARSALVESLELVQVFFYDPYLACELERSLPSLLNLRLNAAGDISEEHRELLQEFFARHKPEVAESPVPEEEKTPVSRQTETSDVSNVKVATSEPAKDRVLIELGALQGGKIYREGVELSEWKWPKARALLFFLAEKQETTIDQIQTEFWSESNDVKASTVYSLLSDLRKAVQPLEIKSKNKRYSLKTDSYYYDAREFEQRAKSLLSRKDKASVEELEAVLALHQREFLDNLSGQWIEERRQGLISLYINLAMMLAQLYFTQRAHRQAIDTARRVLQWDRYSEEAHKIIIACYRVMGQESQARRQQQIYDEALEEFEN